MGEERKHSIIDIQNPGAVQNSVLFEYCEEQYALLKQQDGAYYAKKHDIIVYKKACQKFCISEDEVDKVYQTFTKRAADIEMARMKKMSPKKRKKFMEQRAHDVLCENHDNPFFRIYGEPSDELKSPLQVLHDEYQQMVEHIAAAGWTIPLSIDIKHFEQLKTISSDASALDSFMGDFYAGRERKAICRKIEKALSSPAKKAMFSECVAAYESAMYSTCSVSLLSLLDGFISEFGDDPSNVKVMRVCHYHFQDEKSKGHDIKSLCWLSMYQFTHEVFQKSDFTQEEPDTINRHWLQHGRSDRIPNEIDCIKLFNALSTLTMIRQEEETK